MQRRARFAWLAVGLAIGLGVVLTPPIGLAAQDASPAAKLGETIARRDCGGCHATGADDVGAMPQAPAFRALSARYPIENLEEALAEGISVGHPIMPERYYPEDQIRALTAYLRGLQPKERQEPNGG